jgi:hypothetical protein
MNKLLLTIFLFISADTIAQHAPIPIRFNLRKPGFVTLVIDNDKGIRVRNLISAAWYPAGDNTVYWDGLDDWGRDRDAARHGVYYVPGKFVEPGKYRIRGLVRDSIKPFYEFATYSTGTPPWRTPDDHTGAWLANHTPPQAALFVPAALSPVKEPVVLLGCYVTEGPDGLAWVDLDGKKRGGKAWIGGTWTAAPFLASDKGAKSATNIAAYTASVWETAKQSGQAELRVNALTLTSKNDYGVQQIVKLPAGAMKNDSIYEVIGGLAVHDGIAVVSLKKANKLLYIDVKQKKLIDSESVQSPRGLAFDAAGRLLVLSGGKLLRNKEVLIQSLPDPVAITFDARQRIYISDRGNSHTIKVFDENGKFITQIGKPGAPRTGPYDPLHMNNPAGIAIDSKEQLWVTEEEFLPKRVSVWSLDGRLIKAFYGPPKYGGGGTLDPKDTTAFYYVEPGRGAMELSLDWKTGSTVVRNIFYRAGNELAWRSAGPELPLEHNGKRYFANCYNSSPTGGHVTGFLFIEKNGMVQPCAAMGKANTWDVLKEEQFKAGWPQGKAEYFFIWSDTNNDGQTQMEEVSFTKGISGGITVMPDLSFCISRLGDKALRLPVTGFNKQGVPSWSLSNAELVATGVMPPASSGGDQLLAMNDGWAALTLGIAPFARESISGTKNGVAVWSYPNLWPGLHASHSAPLPENEGQIIGATRLLGGPMDLGKRIGQLWAVNGNHGSVYFFTQDGLFVAALFDVMRKGKLWRMPVAYRNMPLDGISLGEENFWPGITKTNNGNVYLVDGARSSLVRLDGIGNIQRLPDAELVVSAEDMQKSRAWQLEAEVKRQKENNAKILSIGWLTQPPVVDGKPDEYAQCQWADIDKRGVKAYFNANTKPYNLVATAAVYGDRLYMMYKTGNEKLLQNTGEMPVALFKTGGALDLMIGADLTADSNRRKPVAGDSRLLVSMVNGKPQALLYKAVVPGTKERDRVPFTSPVQTIFFDKVEDVSKQIILAGNEGNYELSVPLEILGLKPVDGIRISADIGVLRGDNGQTTSRIYWSNKATGITADVPSEAMLTPYLWGKFEFKK